jgi:hypothetical protein
MVANWNTRRKRKNTLSIIGLAALLSVAALPLAIGFRAPPPPAPADTTNTVDTTSPSAGVDFGKLPLACPDAERDIFGYV